MMLKLGTRADLPSLFTNACYLAVMFYLMPSVPDASFTDIIPYTIFLVPKIQTPAGKRASALRSNMSLGSLRFHSSLSPNPHHCYRYQCVS